MLVSSLSIVTAGMGAAHISKKPSPGKARERDQSVFLTIHFMGGQLRFWLFLLE
jgi:hypothetical protein